MSKRLGGDASHKLSKKFQVDQTKPAILARFGYYFDGVVGGEYAEFMVYILNEAGDTVIGNGYLLHNSGPAGVFDETIKCYHGNPKINSGNNQSDYDNIPFAEGQTVYVQFVAPAVIWAGYKFQLTYAQVEMSD